MEREEMFYSVGKVKGGIIGATVGMLTMLPMCIPMCSHANRLENTNAFLYDKLDAYDNAKVVYQDVNGDGVQDVALLNANGKAVNSYISTNEGLISRNAYEAKLKAEFEANFRGQMSKLEQ